MEIILNIILFFISMFILYSVIEAAVRRGIDNSETGKMLQRFMEEKEINYPPAISDEEIEAELEKEQEKQD